ncbi:MAG: hypothetical protein K1W20_15510 [Lachnospiraceae bacterium]|nr:hypothetical protein [Lachnospiraceae bacterium]
MRKAIEYKNINKLLHFVDLYCRIFMRRRIGACSAGLSVGDMPV